MPASSRFPGLPASWREEILSFNNGQLSMRLWFNPDGDRGRGLFLVHGFGEQSDRYLHFPHYLQTSVDVIAAVDLLGHGLSKGQRGHCENIQDIKQSVTLGFQAFQDWLNRKDWKKQLHWFGHSFGGLMTLSVLADRPDLPLRSVTISAPLLDLSMPLPKVKKFFGELIEPILPRLPLKNEVEKANLSRDPDVCEEYKRNTLNHSLITPRMFRQMTLEMARMRSWTGPLHHSTLMILPQDDGVVSTATTFRLWPTWPVVDGKKKELSLWPAGRHESTNDIDKDRVFNAIEDWIRKN